MTDERKGREINSRVRRLSDIRAELAVAKAELRSLLAKLRAAGQAVSGSVDVPLSWQPSGQLKDWPTKVEIEQAVLAVSVLRNEADTLIQELSALGLDPGLFKLNGEDPL